MEKVDFQSPAMPPQTSGPEYRRVVLSLLTFLFFCGVTFLLWRQQIDHQREIFLHHTETSAEQVRIRLEGLLKTRIASLQLLVDRWVERRPPDFSEGRFLAFAEALFKHYPGFHSISWVDSEGSIQWIYPESDGMDAGGKGITEHADPGYLGSFAGAKDEMAPRMTPTLPLPNGDHGFEIFLPVIYDGDLQGYVHGAFLLKDLMESSLPGEMLDTFGIELYEEGKRVYQSGAQPYDLSGYVVKAERDIALTDKVWRLSMKYRSAEKSVNAIPILLFGVGLSAAIAILLQLLLRRMNLYKQSRDRALHEIEEREKVETALRENEQRLQATLIELNEGRAELESFVYTVSHDLKTPIVTIEGFIGALREDFGACITDDGDRYLTYMSNAARKMEALIDDLLQLSRIGRVTQAKTKFPLSQVVESSIEILKPQIQSRNIRVIVQEDLPEVYGEKKRIIQAIDNLLSNAVKYIGEDNPAPCIVFGSEEKAGATVFFIRDNGIGIEERYFEKIFQIFQRLPSANRMCEGTGIGLAIVKRIIEYHGGAIWLESEPGKGSTFYFTFDEKEAVK